MQRCKITIKKCFALIAVSFFFSVDLLAAENAEKELPKALSGTGFSDPNIAGNLLQTTLGLLVVLVVIGAAAWAFKRFGNVHMGAQGRMKVIGGVSLGTRERAVLLQVGDQQLVVGVAPGRVQTLHVLDKPMLLEEKTSAAGSFSSRLQTAILNRKSAGSEGRNK